MILSGNQLVRSGQSSYLKAKTKVNFLSQEITLDIDSTNQEWELRLMARIKTIGVNTRAVVILPWEELLFDERALINVPEYMLLPFEHLTNAMAARQAALDYLGTMPLSLSEMTRIMNSKQKGLRLLDSSFDLELNFLNFCAETLLTERIHQQVLSELPSAKKQPTMQQVGFRRCSW